MNEPLIKVDPVVDEHRSQHSNTKASNKELASSDAIKEEDDDDDEAAEGLA